MIPQTSIDNLICRTIEEVIRDGGRTAPEVTHNDSLRSDLGLDSLDLAVVVVRLQDRLGVDPFRRERHTVRSVAQLIAIYDEALTSSA